MIKCLLRDKKFKPFRINIISTLPWPCLHPFLFTENGTRINNFFSFGFVHFQKFTHFNTIQLATTHSQAPSERKAPQKFQPARKRAVAFRKARKKKHLSWICYFSRKYLQYNIFTRNPIPDLLRFGFNNSFIILFLATIYLSKEEYRYRRVKNLISRYCPVLRNCSFESSNTRISIFSLIRYYW